MKQPLLVMLPVGKERRENVVNHTLVLKALPLNSHGHALIGKKGQRKYYFTMYQKVKNQKY